MFQRIIDGISASTGTTVRLTSLAAGAALALFITTCFLCAAAFISVVLAPLSVVMLIWLSRQGPEAPREMPSRRHVAA